MERAVANADKINAANAELERQSHETFIAEHFAIVHVTEDKFGTKGRCDTCGSAMNADHCPTDATHAVAIDNTNTEA